MCRRQPGGDPFNVLNLLKKVNVLYSMDVRLMCSVLMFYEIQTDDILVLKLFVYI